MLHQTITIDLLYVLIALAGTIILLVVGFLHFLNVKRDSDKQNQEVMLLRSEKILNERLQQFIQQNNLNANGQTPPAKEVQVIESNDIASLTKKEKEVMQYEARGLSSKEIAEQMTISVNTVSNHFANIKGKTGMSSRAERIKFSIQNNLVS